jgi:transposase-like protein
MAMSDKSPRKKHTATHKAKVALEAIRGLKTANELAQEFGVHPTQVAQWKKIVLDETTTLFDIKRGPQPTAPAHEETDNLYAEIGRLKVELDWLKKKSGVSLS